MNLRPLLRPWCWLTKHLWNDPYSLVMPDQQAPGHQVVLVPAGLFTDEDIIDPHGLVRILRSRYLRAFSICDRCSKTRAFPKTQPMRSADAPAQALGPTEILPSL